MAAEAANQQSSSGLPVPPLGTIGVMGLAAEPLGTSEVCVAPLQVLDVDELAPLLADVVLYRFIGGEPPDHVFSRQREGASPDGREVWLNWVVRNGPAQHAIGTVQATVTEGENGRVAELAWVIGTAYPGRGLAKTAARLVAEWLISQHGVDQSCCKALTTPTTTPSKRAD